MTKYVEINKEDFTKMFQDSSKSDLLKDALFIGYSIKDVDKSVEELRKELATAYFQAYNTGKLLF